MPSSPDATCAKCKTRFALPALPKRTFLGFQKITCPACGALLVYPLTTGYRVAYWIILAFMLLPQFIATFSEGGVGVPGCS